jgi:2-oxoisovalerate dehydrogenase E1 component
VLFFEHKFLYRSVSGLVPDAWYTLPEARATVHGDGEELLIVTYGWGVHQALKLVKEKQLPVRVLDLRTLLPWDQETVAAEVKRCGKELVLNEDTLTGSIASDIAAWIGENCFQYLDAPVRRLGSLDTPVPLAPSLENHFLPWGRLEQVVRELLDY